MVPVSRVLVQIERSSRRVARGAQAGSFFAVVSGFDADGVEIAFRAVNSPRKAAAWRDHFLSDGCASVVIEYPEAGGSYGGTA